MDQGPCAPPVTSVRAQELKRDDATGETLLRLVPVHADKVHFEIGGPATTGSALVPDLQKFATTDLRLSFLAVDSNGQHDTGPATAWQNRITLKSRFFQQGSQRMCEILAAPPVPIFYTTDGSTPSTASGVYEDPFPVPDGTICVSPSAKRTEFAPIRSAPMCRRANKPSPSTPPSPPPGSDPTRSTPPRRVTNSSPGSKKSARKSSARASWSDHPHGRSSRPMPPCPSTAPR